jgi:pimeloyl-ACP methyl ester carboxylesterase
VAEPLLTDQLTDRFIAGEERWANFKSHAYRMRYLFLRTERPSGKPAAVFIHGFLGYSFSWRFNLKEFSRDRDVYAIDLLGIGDSDRPPRGLLSFSFPESARRVLDWLRDLELTNVDLIGTSHGGAVAMFMAALDRRAEDHPLEGAPQRHNAIGRLVLVAPANPYSRRGRKRIWFFNTAFGAWLLKTTGGLDRIKDLSLDFMYGDRKKITPHTRAGYRRIVAHPQSFEYALEVIKTWHSDMDTLLTELPGIADIPTLLVWGERDITVPTETAPQLAAHFHCAKLVIMPGSGHLPYEEDPEIFNREVLGYLDAPLQEGC